MQFDFRRANDRIARRALELRADDVRVPFICECADATCLDPVPLTVADYDEHCARGQAVIVPGHPLRTRTR